ncbi:MAG: hypothetical protein IPN58_17355 [Anaerolineales bacterium]|nr:hypothetical protein [Anaerolineales bacterium]
MQFGLVDEDDRVVHAEVAEGEGEEHALMLAVRELVGAHDFARAPREPEATTAELEAGEPKGREQGRDGLLEGLEHVRQRFAWTALAKRARRARCLIESQLVQAVEDAGVLVPGSRQPSARLRLSAWPSEGGSCGRREPSIGREILDLAQPWRTRVGGEEAPQAGRGVRSQAGRGQETESLGLRRPAIRTDRLLGGGDGFEERGLARRGPAGDEHDAERRPRAGIGEGVGAIGHTAYADGVEVEELHRTT